MKDKKLHVKIIIPTAKVIRPDRFSVAASIERQAEKPAASTGEVATVQKLPTHRNRVVKVRSNTYNREG